MTVDRKKFEDFIGVEWKEKGFEIDQDGKDYLWELWTTAEIEFDPDINIIDSLIEYIVTRKMEKRIFSEGKIITKKDISKGIIQLINLSREV